MRKFSELKEFANQHLGETLRMGKQVVQVYSDLPLQFNIKFDGEEYPNIKFHERREGIFTVAVMPIGKDIIKYGNYERQFNMDDDIENLAKDFPNGTKIDQIVACILSYQK